MRFHIRNNNAFVHRLMELLVVHDSRLSVTIILILFLIVWCKDMKTFSYIKIGISVNTTEFGFFCRRGNWLLLTCILCKYLAYYSQLNHFSSSVK